MTAWHARGFEDLTSPTERRHPETEDIDVLSAMGIVETINDEDATVAHRVAEVLPDIASLVETAFSRVKAGGSIHYFGAGSSGRFAVLDAAEVPPTYGVPAQLFQAHIAGGASAMTGAVEDAEDNENVGFSEAVAAITERDVVIGLAASGRTPFVAGALRAANEIGAYTAVVTSNPSASLGDLAELHICVRTGPEVVTGSTRMKAGTAQKLVLHTFSTALMVKLGHTYSNLMVDVVATNEKLRRRVLRILAEAAEIDIDVAAAALDAARGDTKVALTAILTELDSAAAAKVLSQYDGSIRRAVESESSKEISWSGEELLLGLDVGASGYRMVLMDCAAESTVKRWAGSIRPATSHQGVDFSAIARAVSAVLHALPDSVKTGVRSVGIGVAGAKMLGGNLGRLESEFLNLPQVQLVTSVPDSVACYIGALGFGPGAVLAAGTGAVAVGTDVHDIWRRIDGLGFIVGDYGSGAWIGRRGLESAVRATQNRQHGSTALADELNNYFGPLEAFIQMIHRSADRSALLASFASAVFRCADNGDAIAKQIVDEAAEELSETLLLAADGIEGPVAVVGGLAKSRLYAILADKMVQAGRKLVVAKATPAVGAARYANGMANDGLPGVFGSLQLSTWRAPQQMGATQ